MTAILELVERLRGSAGSPPLEAARQSPQQSTGIKTEDRNVAQTEPHSASLVSKMDPRLAKLSEREYEVLGLIAEGASNKRIAQRLNLSPHTVKRHVANILDKADAHSRAALISLALSGQPVR